MCGCCFPRLYAAASLKRRVIDLGMLPADQFSAALCRGLIEACAPSCGTSPSRARFPRLYAAASLKRVAADECAGDLDSFPRLYAAASLKQGAREAWGAMRDGFPRLYAAASLKQMRVARIDRAVELFSAALCRGLIEAREREMDDRRRRGVFRGFMPRPH